jgi:hypothetical protein
MKRDKKGKEEQYCAMRGAHQKKEGNKRKERRIMLWWGDSKRKALNELKLHKKTKQAFK